MARDIEQIAIVYISHTESTLVSLKEEKKTVYIQITLNTYFVVFVCVEWVKLRNKIDNNDNDNRNKWLFFTMLCCDVCHAALITSICQFLQI